MIITLNKNIEAEITKNHCEFQLQKRKKTNYIRVQLQEIQTAFVSPKRLFSGKLFLIFIAVGLLGGLAHYLYDTVILGYNPNPLLISIITGGIILIGYPLSFRSTPILRLKFRATGSKTLVFPLYRYIPRSELDAFLKRFDLEYTNDTFKEYLLESSSDSTLVYQNKGKIAGGRIARIRQINWLLFFLFILIALLGGAGHYLYDTMILEYDPNPLIIGSIVAGVTVIGLFVSFRKRLVLDILPDARVAINRIRFYLQKDLTDENCKDLLEIIGNEESDSTSLSDGNIAALIHAQEQAEQSKKSAFDEESLDKKVQHIVEQTITQTLVTLVEETVKKEIKKTATTTPPKSREVQALSQEFFQDVPKELEEIVSETTIPVAPIRQKRQDYGTMNVTELKAVAKRKGIKGYYKLKKKELISALRNL